MKNGKSASVLFGIIMICKKGFDFMKNFEEYFVGREKEMMFEFGNDEEYHYFSCSIEENVADLNTYLDDLRIENGLDDDDILDEDLTDLIELFIDSAIITVTEDDETIGTVEIQYINTLEISNWCYSFLETMDNYGELYEVAAILRDNGFDYEEDEMSQPRLFYVTDIKFDTDNWIEKLAVIQSARGYAIAKCDYNDEIERHIITYFLNLSDDNYEKYKHKPTMEEQMAMIIGEKQRMARTESVFGNKNKAEKIESELVFEADGKTSMVVMSEKQKEYYANKFLDRDYEKSYPDAAFDSEELELMESSGYERIGNTQLMVFDSKNFEGEYTDCENDEDDI